MDNTNVQFFKPNNHKHGYTDSSWRGGPASAATVSASGRMTQWLKRSSLPLRKWVEGFVEVEQPQTVFTKSSGQNKQGAPSSSSEILFLILSAAQKGRESRNNLMMPCHQSHTHAHSLQFSSRRRKTFLLFFPKNAHRSLSLCLRQQNHLPAW